jgi:hypothetical protein
MKKAASNLTQQFKVYIPSKRLPIYEQKRMLSKELQDFLYIYKKDTELLKIDSNYDIEAQKLKNKKNSFNETLLINFLNKCSEMQLEEIMSSYMKNSKDSSAFLGTNNNNNNKKLNDSQQDLKQSNNKNKLSTPEPTLKTHYNKIVTAVSISKSSKNIKSNDNDDNSFISTSNSSLNSSSEVNIKSKSKINEEILNKRLLVRTKSAQNDNKKLNPITREKLTSGNLTKPQPRHSQQLFIFLR